MKTVTDNLIELLQRLRRANIDAKLRYDRDEAVSIDVAVPGQRWEIDVLADGSVEVEVFKSDGTIHRESKLEDLFRQYSD